jgi:serine-threonine kinase receptor-associated protein
LVDCMQFMPPTLFPKLCWRNELSVWAYFLSFTTWGFTSRRLKKVSISKCNWLDHNTVLAAGEDGVICLWNVDETDPSKQLTKTLTVEGGGVRDMELVALPPSAGFPIGRTILTVASGQNVTFFDMSTLEVVHSYKMPIHFREEGG